MSEPKVLIERQGPVAIVTLNDASTRNALGFELQDELYGYLEAANADTSLGCIVLAANGEGFSSGGNVKDMLKGEDPMFGGRPHEMTQRYRETIQRMPRLFAALDVPVIAAVHGLALGVGCDLATMCDIRLASPDAKFAESFLRVGLVSGDGGAWYLPRVVGLPRALEMAFTCRMVDAEEARQWGLVNRIVEREKLLETAVEMAHQIASFPPVSVRLNKRLILQSQSLSLNACLELSAAYQSLVQSTHDQKEAVAALLAKRPPEFKGT